MLLSTSEPELDQRLTMAQVAELANCHPRTVRRAIAAGRLVAFRLDSGRGGRAVVRLRRADVERWLDGEPVVDLTRPQLTLEDISIRPRRPRRSS